MTVHFIKKSSWFQKIAHQILILVFSFFFFLGLSLFCVNFQSILVWECVWWCREHHDFLPFHCRLQSWKVNKWNMNKWIRVKCWKTNDKNKTMYHKNISHPVWHSSGIRFIIKSPFNVCFAVTLLNPNVCELLLFHKYSFFHFSRKNDILGVYFLCDHNRFGLKCTAWWTFSIGFFFCFYFFSKNIDLLFDLFQFYICLFVFCSSRLISSPDKQLNMLLPIFSESSLSVFQLSFSCFYYF